MSNLIKYNFVSFQNKEKVIIDSEKIQKGVLRGVPLDERQDTGQVPQEEIDTSGFESAMDLFTSDLTKEEARPLATESLGEISEEEVHELYENERQKAQTEAERILIDAREQAAVLIQSASEEIAGEREAARKSGYQDGYAAGEIAASEKYEKLQQELKDRMQEQEKEYSQMIAEIEPRYGEILAKLLQKLTGVLAEEHSDILLYLIRNSLDNIDRSKHYTIRYSTEDATLIDMNRTEIKEKLGEKCVVEFMEEKTLSHNECMIETDSQMVDCGLKTQLESLTEAIKMLAL